MKKSIKLIVTMLLLATSMSACGFEVVPPATKGKVLTTKGYNMDVLEPGKYTLWGRDELILLETNTNVYKEKVNVILADKLTLTVDVRFRGRISGTPKIINSMFNDITPGPDKVVSFKEVYAVYGRMTVRNKTREIVRQYTVEDVHANYDRISIEIAKVLTEAFKSTPLQVSDVALGSIAYPEVVTTAINAAKERKMAIEKEEAQAKIDLVKKDNEGLLAEAQYKIEMTRARTIADYNKKIGKNITPELLKLKALEVQMAMAENERAVFMPFEAMNSTGAQVRMYQGGSQ